MITSYISRAIKDAYPASKVYTDVVQQGAIDGNFAITLINAPATRLSSNRFRVTYNYVVQYFAKNKESRRECEQVYVKLIGVLSSLAINDTIIHTHVFNYNIVDDVLNMEFNYTIEYLTQSDTDDNMEEYIILNEVK